MTFSFSLYAAPLQVTLVVYFERRLSKLKRLELLRGSDMYCH